MPLQKDMYATQLNICEVELYASGNADFIPTTPFSEDKNCKVIFLPSSSSELSTMHLKHTLKIR